MGESAVGSHIASHMVHETTATNINAEAYVHDTHTASEECRAGGQFRLSGADSTALLRPHATSMPRQTLHDTHTASDECDRRTGSASAAQIATLLRPPATSMSKH